MLSIYLLFCNYPFIPKLIFCCLLDITFEVKPYKTCIHETSQQKPTNKRKNVRTKVVDNIKSTSKASLPGSYPSELSQKQVNNYSTNCCQTGSLPGSYPGLNHIQRQVSSQIQSYSSKTSQKQFDNHSFGFNPQNFKGMISILYSSANESIASSCVYLLTTFKVLSYLLSQFLLLLHSKPHFPCKSFLSYFNNITYLQYDNQIKSQLMYATYI